MTDIWDKIADSASDAQILRVKSQILSSIIDYVNAKGWKQVKLANKLGLTKSRISDLMNGKISKFSLDALFKILGDLGMVVTIEINHKKI